MPTKPKGRLEALSVGRLSESLEDYLEIILQLQQDKRVARVRDIAARKGVSNASVSNAISRLVQGGFVLHEAHEYVELTDRGAELARRVLDRHEFLVAFLTDVLQVSAEVSEKDACAMEHHLSAETLDRLAGFYDLMCSRPELVKARDLARESLSVGTIVSLDALRPGENGTIVRLTASCPVRQRLVDAGLLPNVRVEVRAGPDGRTMRIVVHGSVMDIDILDASCIMVRRG